MYTETLRFTEQEFEIMVNELLVDSPPRFDMLCTIAEKGIKGYVVSKSSMLFAKRGQATLKTLVEDIMQTVLLKLMQSTVSGFLLKGEKDNTVNYDPVGFQKWMFKIAANAITDCVKRENKETQVLDIVDGGIIADDGYGEDPADVVEDVYVHQLLNLALNIVLNSGTRVYKILVWVANFIYIAETNGKQHEAVKELVANFENRTLGEMWKSILKRSDTIDWLSLDIECINAVERQLDELSESGCIYRNATLKDFYMKKGGAATISDWINRQNDMAKRRLESILKDTE